MTTGRQFAHLAARDGGCPRACGPLRALCLLVVACACLTGCGGCRQTPAQQAAQAKQEQDAEAALEERRKKLEEEAKKQKPFAIERLTPLLSERLIATDEGGALRLAKPGHWATTVQTMKANLADFEGRITCEVVDAKGQPIGLPHTRYRMASSRPAVLAKGRAKRVENELYAPLAVDRMQVRSQLVNRLSGREESGKSEEPWTLMPSHQYFLMVVAREPARYAFLKVTDAVRAPYEDENGVAPPHYRVVLADATKALPLPSNVLTWTSVAYVVWDEVNLDRIDRQQQQALVDWLHWGGRLIISGPDSLDSLRGSFLADYLPAEGGETTTITAEQAAKLSAAWSRSDATPPDKPIAMTKPWSAVTLAPRPGAHALPGGEGLFYERAVGAGSIVVSAMQLGERDLVNWSGYDGFLNGALLRRPARQFQTTPDDPNNGLQTVWRDFAGRTHDAYFTTPLRWFARDTGTQANARNASLDVGPANNNPRYNPIWGGGADYPEMEWKVDRAGGLGEWNEFTPVSQAARGALVTAAGVRVPPASFVVFCLAVYLFVLAPLNWMVFYALNRVEWAWISAPIIALIGTVIVVRQAQLDIGFVRSQTEIGLLELQGDLPRGHLSRYTAIYSSLSSVYDLEFDEGSAVATPFPRDNVWTPAIGDSLSTVAFEKYDRPRLRGMEVSSATTQMVHSEQMVELDGPIRMFSPGGNPHLKQLENKSGFNLSDVVVLHRTAGDDEPQLEGCWVGELKSGAGTLLPWKSVRTKRGELPYAAQRTAAAESDRRKRLDVDPLLELAFQFAPSTDPLYGGRDEWRLVGRIDEPLPGVAASPEASQTAGSTVVLAHLAYGPPPAPVPDANRPSDVMPAGRRGQYDEMLEEASTP